MITIVQMHRPRVRSTILRLLMATSWRSLTNGQRALKLQIGTGIKSKTDYTGATSSTYNASGGVSYEVTRDLSFDLGIRSSVKDTGSGGGGAAAADDDPSRAASTGGGY